MSFIELHAAITLILLTAIFTSIVLFYTRLLVGKADENLNIATVAFEFVNGMAITDARCNILRINRAFTECTGYSSEEVIGRNPTVLKSGRHDSTFYADMWKCIGKIGVWEGEIWNRRKNGEIYPEHLSITAVKNPFGIVTHYFASFTDISYRKNAEEAIKNLAFYDALTGLPNRRLLLDRMKQTLIASARSEQEGALLYINLDKFKTINDTLGYDKGDLLLQQVALRLESSVRKGDTVARLGGDEFVIMLEDLSGYVLEAAEQTKIIGNKIFDALNQPFHLDSHEYRGTVSIGATLFNGHKQQIDKLLKQADIAMYQSKKAGSNLLCFFDQKMQDSINARANLESELLLALENQQFQLFYQIQVDSLHRPVGAEALIRWTHPERGMISPTLFIPLAEETGAILQIGKWVLETACSQLKAWQQNELSSDLVLAINVSALQFSQPDFVSQLYAAVQHYGISPNRLKLELTESLLLDSVEDMIATMSALKNIGVKFSLDDFGTGYSSLQYLKRLPLDQLKIDQSFVRDLISNCSDRSIVRTIIAMAKALSMDVIAEGVETEEQRQILAENGCNHFQGYLYSKPLPIEQFETLLKWGLN